ncbi:MAG TPA: BppU family phage baseplate upper protein [Clostridiales bacterium]|nr:BppU family phage baseplate upper protein [Clostridiales bacterium]
MRKPIGVLINLQRNAVEIDNNTINFVTGDTGTCSFVFRVMLDDYNPLPSDNIVPRIMVVAPSGASLQDTCDVLNPATAEYGIVLKNVFITESGWHEIELQMFDKDTELIRATSPKFKYNARMSLQDDSTAQATNQFSQLQDLIIEVETALDRVSEETLEVVNNLVETVPGKALDAVQGKTLKAGLDAVALQSNENATELTNHKTEVTSVIKATSRDVSLTGEQIVPLINGRTAEKITILAMVIGSSKFSNGVATTAGQSCIAQDATSVMRTTSTTIYISDSASSYSLGGVTINDGNISINWTKVGTPTGTAQLTIMADYHA